MQTQLYEPPKPKARVYLTVAFLLLFRYFVIATLIACVLHMVLPPGMVDRCQLVVCVTMMATAAVSMVDLAIDGCHVQTKSE